MATPFEEIDPRPDVGPQVESGFIRYKRHTTRPTAKKHAQHTPTDIKNTALSYVILFVVYFIILVAIAFSFDKLLIDNTPGFSFLILSIISGFFVIMWASNQPKITERVLAITLLILLSFVFLWIIVEFYKLKTFTLYTAVIFAILIFFLMVSNPQDFKFFIPVFISYILAISVISDTL